MKKISVRSMFIAEKGNILIAADLSQAESWVVAHLAGERNMKHALMYGDIHTESAGNALFFPNVGCGHVWIKDKGVKQWVCENCQRIVTELMRYVGKRYNHASSYRMGAERAAQVINKDSDKPPFFTVTVRQSKKFSEAWHGYFNLKPWWADIETQLGRNRTMVTPYGFKRTFFAGWGNELFKEATAFVPQSTVASHALGKVQKELGIKGGLREIYNELVKPYAPQHKLINFSHDSFILEVPESVGHEIGLRALELFRRPLVVNNEEFTIPVDGEIGYRWQEMEKLAA